MPSIAKWSLSSTGLTTILSSQLDALGNNTATVASDAYSNDTNLNQYVDIELVLASFSPATTPHAIIYILEAIDGTNYPNPSATDIRLLGPEILAHIPGGLTAATSQRLVYRMAVIPPGTFKIVLENQFGGNFAASGNTLKFLPYNLNFNG